MIFIKKKAIKVVAIFACLAGFSINSLATIRAFLDGAKVNSQQQHTKFKSPIQMPLPTMVFCNAGLKRLNSEIGMDVHSMEDQDAQSWTWDKLYLRAWIKGDTLIQNDSDIFSVEKLFTRYYGICFAMTFLKPVYH